MLRLVRGLKTDSKEVEGGRCMIGSDGKLCLSEEKRGKVWKNSMEGIMNGKKTSDIIMWTEMQWKGQYSVQVERRHYRH